MLLMKPNCEYCDKDLPPDSAQACICSYECTFCTECVDNILHNVCPNCGGGFAARPIRPRIERRPGVSLQHNPASTRRIYKKFSAEEIAEFVAGVRDIKPEDR